MDVHELEEGTSLTLQFEKRGGMIPGIAQDVETGQILMIGSVNQVAFDESLKTGYATWWSTSRDELWTKGKTSGDLLKIEDILIDCDQDAVIYVVKRLGDGACHTVKEDGSHRTSCFYRKLDLGSGKLTHIEK